jgi:hypothetical protein
MGDVSDSYTVPDSFDSSAAGEIAAAVSMTRVA